jgi:hypothetical protein
MPDVAGIDKFDYHPEADHSEVALEGEKAREASKDTEATPDLQDPPVDPQGGN